jgi:hypothetical protein
LVQVNVYVAGKAAGVDCVVPPVASDPIHAPLAAQESALALDQVSWIGLPAAATLGAAVKLTVGAVGGRPPPPEQAADTALIAMAIDTATRAVDLTCCVLTIPAGIPARVRAVFNEMTPHLPSRDVIFRRCLDRRCRRPNVRAAMRFLHCCLIFACGRFTICSA